VQFERLIFCGGSAYVNSMNIDTDTAARLTAAIDLDPAHVRSALDELGRYMHAHPGVAEPKAGSRTTLQIGKTLCPEMDGADPGTAYRARQAAGWRLWSACVDAGILIAISCTSATGRRMPGYALATDSHLDGCPKAEMQALGKTRKAAAREAAKAR